MNNKEKIILSSMMIIIFLVAIFVSLKKNESVTAPTPSPTVRPTPIPPTPCFEGKCA